MQEQNTSRVDTCVHLPMPPSLFQEFTSDNLVDRKDNVHPNVVSRALARKVW